MSKDNTTQITPEETVVNEVAESTIEADESAVVVPVAKTRKERKKERKEIKKHKKQVKKEARLHSAKTTKLYNFMVTVVSLLVVATMIFCSVSVVKLTMGIGSAPEAGEEGAAGNEGNNGGNTGNTGNTGNAGGNTGNAGGDAGNAGNTGAEDTSGVADAGDPGDVTSKAGAVDLYKKAHAKVLAEAKSVTRTLDNNTHYKEYLEVGGNSALAGVAKTLMGMFLKANEEPVVHEGAAAIKENFPPSNGSADGLTADMIGKYEVKEEGDNYIVTLYLNSTEENPDLGDNAAHLVNIVSSKAVEDAAAGFVGFTGLRNEYIAPSIEATINKTTGQMTELHTICPSYMKFDRATVMSIINVDNVGIGLQYETKWTVQY